MTVASFDTQKAEEILEELGAPTSQVNYISRGDFFFSNATDEENQEAIEKVIIVLLESTSEIVKTIVALGKLSFPKESHHG